MILWNSFGVRQGFGVLQAALGVQVQVQQVV